MKMEINTQNQQQIFFFIMIFFFVHTVFGSIDGGTLQLSIEKKKKKSMIM